MTNTMRVGTFAGAALVSDAWRDRRSQMWALVECGRIVNVLACKGDAVHCLLNGGFGAVTKISRRVADAWRAEIESP